MRAAVLLLGSLGACADGVGLETLSGASDVESVPSLFPESAITFGEVPVGDSSTRTLTITPSGDTPLSIRGVYFDDGTADAFEREPLELPIGLRPGDEVSIALYFYPDSVGTFNGDVVVFDGDRHLSRRLVGFACDPLPGQTDCN